MVDDGDRSAPELQDDDDPTRTGLLVAVGILAFYLVFFAVEAGSDSTVLSLLRLAGEVALISVVIWQVCEPFADAAQWIGMTFRIPGSVRGATLDAVASSSPELFSGIFFVVLAVSAANPEDVVAAGAEGFGSTIATCAGSAIYNMILIPAFCALVISYSRPERPTIDIEDEVITRDGAWFVGCQLLLVIFLFEDTMTWWMGAVFLAVYGAYILTLYRHAVRYRSNLTKLSEHFAQHGTDVTIETVVETFAADGVRISHAVVREAHTSALSAQAVVESGEDEPPLTAGVLFGYFRVPLNHLSVWLAVAVCTLVAAGACYFLVESTRETATLLDVPTFFVAVILAAAASSVPDTFLAIAAAHRGDDSGAVSNAFGSNIFDICVCLSVPLFVNSYLTDWKPVSLMQDGEPMAGLVVLRWMLIVLTVITLAIMWHKRQLTRGKAIVLCGLYGIFIAYAVLGSLGLI